MPEKKSWRPFIIYLLIVIIGSALAGYAEYRIRLFEAGVFRKEAEQQADSGRSYGGTKETIAGGESESVTAETESTESGMSWIGRVVSRNVSGVCLLAGREELYRGEFADLIESGIPLVSIEHEVAGHMTVYSSHRENIRLLLAYLKDKGYRRVVHIGATGPESERLAVLFAQEAEKLNMTCLEASEGERGPGMITSVKKQPEEIGRIAVRKLIYIAEHPEADCGERIFVPGEICEGTAAGQAEVGLAVEIPLEIIT